ncbi:hypothetical protein Hypma_002249 [Hypsizygus marmoreus]|uniref:Uncharacterized protein n=1 Tax=Hypsizygus marmoreus TaxID=39966 RepID=A0A369K349_HYPMA|nr:hypothetical protein Hypma_002249 [Hypsizygus marmoreus]
MLYRHLYDPVLFNCTFKFASVSPTAFPGTVFMRKWTYDGDSDRHCHDKLAVRTRVKAKKEKKDNELTDGHKARNPDASSPGSNPANTEDDFFGYLSGP